MNQNISTENQCWFITKNKTKLRSLRGKKFLLSPVNCPFSPSHVLQLSLAGLTSHSSLTCSPKCLCQRQGQEGQALPLISLQITADLRWPCEKEELCGKSAWGDLSLKKPTFFHNPKLSLKGKGGKKKIMEIPPFQMGHYWHSPTLGSSTPGLYLSLDYVVSLK